MVEKKEERAREKQQIQSGVQFTRVAYSGVGRGGEEEREGEIGIGNTKTTN